MLSLSLVALQNDVAKKSVVVDDVHVLLGIWSRRCSCVTHDCAVYTACTVLSGVCFRFSSLKFRVCYRYTPSVTRV